MSRKIISIENVSKRYTINTAKDSYLSLRDEFGRWLSASRFRAKKPAQEFWALSNISFDIEEGEAVGIIGKNGAGKSTLLKILSRITPPTEGRIRLKGRVASLLEVGTGFHPELTGRENIFLNGAILGMTRKEIRYKFDEIVAFAEIEKFLDTPVKRYSSGMYVRLAFAVAAHLEPEILVIDEVLAVGDSAFQQKCLGKMSEVAQGGRTVLFVSHNLAAVSQLCRRGIVLASGKLDFTGSAEDAVLHYTETSSFQSGRVEITGQNKPDTEKTAQFTGVTITDINKAECSVFFIGDEMNVSIDVMFHQPVKSAHVGFIITSMTKGNIYHCTTTDSGLKAENLSGPITFTVRFSRMSLYPGSYVLSVLMLDGPGNEVLDLVRDSISFQVAEGGPFLQRPLYSHAGVVHEIPEWVITGRLGVG